MILLANTIGRANAAEDPSIENPRIVTFEQCEFQAAFPYPVKSKTMSSGNLNWVQYESVWTGSSTYLRAEGFYTGPTNDIIANLRDRLTQSGQAQGLTTPVVEIQKTVLGIVGIVSGTREQEYPGGKLVLKFYNKTVVGRNSLITLMVSEPRDTFPSTEALFFLKAISRKR